MKKTIEILSWIGNRVGKPPGWERIVRIFASPEKCRGMVEICVIRDDIIFLAQPAVPIGWHVAFFGTYEPELREIFRAVLPKGGVAIDIGANVGWHTLLMAHLVGDKGRVLAAEANPSVRGRLETNLCLNRFGQVEVMPYAIADSERTVEFYGPGAEDADSGNGHVVMDGAIRQHGTIRVEARRLDTIVSAAKIERLDLIKIDVEGFEWPVLQGAQESIAKFRPHVIFEYDAAYATRGEATPQIFAEYFRKHHYRLFRIGQTWAEAVEQNDWPNSGNIWAVPSHV
jgi:FkbM family methyltransferase